MKISYSSLVFLDFSHIWVVLLNNTYLLCTHIMSSPLVHNAMSKIGAVLIHHHILIESSWAFLSPILVIKVQVQIWFWYSGIVPIEALVIVLTVFYDKTVITSSPSVIQTWIFKLMLIIWYAIPNHYFPCSSHGN